MRLGLVQLNPRVCDFRRNVRRILEGASRAFEQGAGLCITPELAVMGYPPLDLVFSRDIMADCSQALADLARAAEHMGPLLVGGPYMPDQRPGVIHNGAWLLNRGKAEAFFGKSLLPNYDVFDEQRYFTPYEGPKMFCLGRIRIGVTICEDVWNDKDFWETTRYGADPVQVLADQGADLLVNLSASPFSLGKQKIRKAMLASLALKYRLPVVFCNQTGGNDELVFDGRSMALDAEGSVLAAAAEFSEDVLVVDTGDKQGNRIAWHDDSREGETWQALVTGVRDYVRKSGFSRVVLGLSGGIDSALVAAVGARALGPENVTGVLMPSPYSSRASMDYAYKLASNLGIKTVTLPINSLMDEYDHSLDPVFHGLDRDTTEENIQARIRGNLLMALSNKRGELVLATGNKSETAVGYCTLYGDMCGALAPISDVPKTLVYSVCRWLNSKSREVIPSGILTRAPSAELRPGQTDQDSLPPYEILDQILHLHVQSFLGFREIVDRGFEPDVVAKVLNMVKKSEFKRRQAAPGIKITDVAFGTGRRMPLACKCTSTGRQ
ncbi:MAG: NAD+ synthase [Desulfonatronovibrionaceae bacterium]